MVGRLTQEDGGPLRCGCVVLSSSTHHGLGAWGWRAGQARAVLLAPRRGHVSQYQDDGHEQVVWGPSPGDDPACPMPSVLRCSSPKPGPGSVTAVGEARYSKAVRWAWPTRGKEAAREHADGRVQVDGGGDQQGSTPGRPGGDSVVGGDGTP